MEAGTNVLVRISSMYPSLRGVYKKIADVLLKDPDSTVNWTISALAQQAGVADSSIVRFCRMLGYQEYVELRIAIARSIIHEEQLLLEEISAEDNYETVLKKVANENIQAIRDTVESIDPVMIAGAVDALKKCKRMEFYGIGTSSVLAFDAYYRFMRMGYPASYATDPHVMRMAANNMSKGCVAVGISYTGRSMDTVRAMQIAHERGATCICITAYTNTPMIEACDYHLVCASKESRTFRESFVSTAAQRIILDSLYASVILANPKQISKKTHDLNQLLNEIRFEGGRPSGKGKA